MLENCTIVLFLVAQSRAPHRYPEKLMAIGQRRTQYLPCTGCVDHESRRSILLRAAWRGISEEGIPHELSYCFAGWTRLCGSPCGARDVRLTCTPWKTRLLRISCVTGASTCELCQIQRGGIMRISCVTGPASTCELCQIQSGWKCRRSTCIVRELVASRAAQRVVACSGLAKVRCVLQKLPQLRKRHASVAATAAVYVDNSERL